MIDLAAVKPVIQAAPMVMQHTFPQLWLVFWSWLIGGAMGAGLMGWYKNVGVKGMISDVQKDVSSIKAQVHAQTAPTTTPTPVA